MWLCAHARVHTHTHLERESEKKSLKMKRNTSPSAATPLSHCVHLPSPFSSPLLSLVLWNSTCYRLAAWELCRDVVCTPTWYSASSQFHIQPCWCVRQTSRTSSSSKSLMTFWSILDRVHWTRTSCAVLFFVPIDCIKIMDVTTLTSPTGLWNYFEALYLAFWPSPSWIFGARSDEKWPYLDERVELTVTLAASLVCTVHLQSMVKYDNTIANANFL